MYNRRPIKIFSMHNTADIAPLTDYNQVFWIKQSGTEFKILSVTWDYRLADSAAGYLDNNNTSNVGTHLYIGSGVDRTITDAFLDPTHPADIVFNSTRLYIFKPKQIFFDSFYVTNEIPLGVECWNHDAISTIQIRCNVTVEIEFIKR